VGEEEEGETIVSGVGRGVAGDGEGARPGTRGRGWPGADYPAEGQGGGAREAKGLRAPRGSERGENKGEAAGGWAALNEPVRLVRLEIRFSFFLSFFLYIYPIRI
jgi:hypothetical protein